MSKNIFTFDDFMVSEIGRLDPLKVCGCFLTGNPIKDVLVPRGVPIPVCDLREDNGVSLGLITDVCLNQSRSTPWIGYTDIITLDKFYKNKLINRLVTGVGFHYIPESKNWVFCCNTQKDYEKLYKKYKKGYVNYTGHRTKFTEDMYNCGIVRYNMDNFIGYRGAPYIPLSVVNSRRPTMFIYDMGTSYTEVSISFPAEYYKMYVPFYYDKSHVFTTSAFPAPAHTLLPSGMIVNGRVDVDFKRILRNFKSTGDVVPLFIDCSHIPDIVSREDYGNEIVKYKDLTDIEYDGFKYQKQSRMYRSELNEIQNIAVEYNKAVAQRLSKLL